VNKLLKSFIEALEQRQSTEEINALVDTRVKEEVSKTLKALSSKRADTPLATVDDIVEQPTLEGMKFNPNNVFKSVQSQINAN